MTIGKSWLRKVSDIYRRIKLVEEGFRYILKNQAGVLNEIKSLIIPYCTQDWRDNTYSRSN
jgi:hypothetical protein